VTIKIEVMTAPGCKRCAGAQTALRAAAASVLGEDGMVWREVDVLEELDYALELGVLTLPAIAVNGELCFSSLPTPNQLLAELTRLRPR